MKSLFPLGYGYFKPFKKALVEKKIKYKTNPEFWFSLHRSRDQKLFDGRKLITPQLQNMPHFTLDEHGWYPDAGGYSLVGCSSVDEEYFYLNLVLGVGLPEHQSLSQVDGHSYDVLQVKGRDGAEQEIWFNVDVPMIMGTTLFAALAVIVANLLADVTYSLIDPRIKKGGQEA